MNLQKWHAAWSAEGARNWSLGTAQHCAAARADTTYRAAADDRGEARARAREAWAADPAELTAAREELAAAREELTAAREAERAAREELTAAREAADAVREAEFAARYARHDLRRAERRARLADERLDRAENPLILPDPTLRPIGAAFAAAVARAASASR